VNRYGRAKHPLLPKSVVVFQGRAGEKHSKEEE
jgi:hypothetical protein